MKKVTVSGKVTLHQHYLYRGYLQIAAIDLMRANAPTLWHLHWDPTQPIATRPLSLRKNGTWYTYGHDFTKNVTELYTTAGAIVTEYDYTPYGTVTATGLEQPIQWSSEHYDAELGMVYYNYRHYNPMDGRWINRDPIAEKGGRNLYGFVRNNVSVYIDRLGKTFQTIVPPEAILIPGHINCIGHAAGLQLSLTPAPGISLNKLFKALGWKCSPMKNKQCKCNCKIEQAMVVFVYVRHPNVIFETDPFPQSKVDEFFINIKNDLKHARLNTWNDAWDVLMAKTTYIPFEGAQPAQVLDFHGVKRNCSKEDGSPQSWEYVPEHGEIGSPEVAIAYRNNPNYFDNPNQILVSMCCKKQRS